MKLARPGTQGEAACEPLIICGERSQVERLDRVGSEKQHQEGVRFERSCSPGQFLFHRVSKIFAWRDSFSVQFSTATAGQKVRGASRLLGKVYLAAYHIGWGAKVWEPGRTQPRRIGINHPTGWFVIGIEEERRSQRDWFPQNPLSITRN